MLCITHITYSIMLFLYDIHKYIYIYLLLNFDPYIEYNFDNLFYFFRPNISITEFHKMMK